MALAIFDPVSLIGGKFSVGELLGIKADDPLQLVRFIERGFSFGALERLRRETGLPLERLATATSISPRTLTRCKKENKLMAFESHRLVSITVCWHYQSNCSSVTPIKSCAG